MLVMDRRPAAERRRRRPRQSNVMRYYNAKFGFFEFKVRARGARASLLEADSKGSLFVSTGGSLLENAAGYWSMNNSPALILIQACRYCRFFSFPCQQMPPAS